ncbi:MAG: hypothetical protein HWD60_18215 [Defluviicoccus sp.]|nr:MAG: hypothetical protein HWD60_18215 [Defluviicoccus sp.]
MNGPVLARLYRRRAIDRRGPLGKDGFCRNRTRRNCLLCRRCLHHVHRLHIPIDGSAAGSRLYRNIGNGGLLHHRLSLCWKDTSNRRIWRAKRLPTGGDAPAPPSRSGSGTIRCAVSTLPVVIAYHVP